MNFTVEIAVITSAVIGAAIGFWSAAVLVDRRQKRLYTRGWNAGREFEATRQLRETLNR